MRATTWSRFCATLTHEISYRVTSSKSDGQPVQDELAVYATARTLISRGAPDTAFGLVGERCGGGKRPNPDALSDSMALVCAELTAEIGELGEPAERIAKIAQSEARGRAVNHDLW